MNFRQTMPILFAVCALSATAKADIYSFGFENINPGTSTAFTDTVGGLSATFSSSADPGGFVVYNTNMFLTLTGNVLGDPGPSGQSNLPLNISFSSELNAIELNFATDDFITASPLTLTAYQGSTVVGTDTTSGMFIGSFFPEGEVAFNGAAFDDVTISSTAPDFAIDNVEVNTATPEPSSVAVLAIGLGVLALASWRRKARMSAASTR